MVALEARQIFKQISSLGRVLVSAGVSLLEGMWCLCFPGRQKTALWRRQEIIRHTRRKREFRSPPPLPLNREDRNVVVVVIIQS